MRRTLPLGALVAALLAVPVAGAVVSVSVSDGTVIGDGSFCSPGSMALEAHLGRTNRRFQGWPESRAFAAPVRLGHTS
jgi:hypothetical protein